MKKTNIYKEKSVSLLIILLFFTATLSYGTTNLDVTVSEIFFNYQDGYTCDALTISDDGNPIDTAEWDSWSLEQHKFAYIMNQSCRNIKVKLHPGLYDGIMHLIIKVSYASGYTDGIGTICNLFIPNYDASKVDDGLILPLTGNFPQSIGVHEFRWHWEIYAIPVNNPNYCAAWGYTDTSHHFYTLLAAPQEPMIHPWESVLDKACKWANGQTVPDEVTTHITDSLYVCGFKYEKDQGRPKYTNYNDTLNFNLSTLMDDLENPSGVTVNCQDIARTIVTFGNALGTNLHAIKYKSNRGRGSLFPTNYIDPIGDIAPTNNPFFTEIDKWLYDDCRLGGFYLHTYVVNADNKVWDATFRYNIGEDPDMVEYSNTSNNVCGKISNKLIQWKLPCNIPESTYLSQLLDNWVRNRVCQTPTDCGEFSNYTFIVREILAN